MKKIFLLSVFCVMNFPINSATFLSRARSLISLRSTCSSQFLPRTRIYKAPICINQIEAKIPQRPTTASNAPSFTYTASSFKVRTNNALKAFFAVTAISFYGYLFYAFNNFKTVPNAIPAKVIPVKKANLSDLVTRYDTLKKEPKSDALVAAANDLLLYFVDNYQETKKLLKTGALDLNDLLEKISEQDGKVFCQKAVHSPWFWDFQRYTYFGLFDSTIGQLKAEYTKKLCSAAIALDKNPIAGFSDAAFKERQDVLKLYAAGKRDTGAFYCFTHKGALGQKNTMCWG